ncbi:MAG: DUF4832 domain-containing protein [Lentisphaerae bacterium]|nr:DUF4832 domain-containing protein [Lentisphaerota bacterium]
MSAIRPVTVAMFVAAGAASGAVVDLRPDWDASQPLANPDKGWYHHHFDNTVEKYLVERDEELTAFPGMDHLYLRLAWAYLEPAEGRFDWKVIDEPIAKWTAKGMGIAFRISCKETGTSRIEQQFATPRWVRDAGAKGGHFVKGKPAGPEAPWEPVYDDPVFLAKLDAFLAAFAARYDGKPWLRYVDIGSFGDWGEGHTSSGSGLKYPFEAFERHIDIHLRHFTKSPLVISDDYVTSLVSTNDRRRLHAKIAAAGIGYRDDSILVDWYVKTYTPTFTVRSPGLFEDTWRRTPTVFELEHYGKVKENGNWVPRPGSSLAVHGGGRTGADYFRGALERLHATWIGFHGYARHWLADNPQLTVEMLNRCGYWFFPHTVERPDVLKAGASNAVSIAWENRGVAPAYRPYTLVLRLEGPETFECAQPSGNMRWMPEPPGKTWSETYALALPASMKPGDYALSFKLRSDAAARDVKLPLKAARQRADGFTAIGRVRVGP